jgi:hypothetical protein
MKVITGAVAAMAAVPLLILALQVSRIFDR